MAIAFVGAADGGNATASSSLTFSYTCGSGSNRLLVVTVLGDSASDLVTGVTYNGVSMTLVTKQLPTNQRWQYMFYLLNPASGAHNVVASASSPCDFFLAGAADYTGVNQSGQPDASTTHESALAATSITTSITTVADNCWSVLCEIGFDGASEAPPAAGTGDTRRAFDGAFGAWGIFDSNSNITPAGSYSMTTSHGAGNAGSALGHIIASFAPSVTTIDTSYNTTIYKPQLRRNY